MLPLSRHLVLAALLAATAIVHSQPLDYDHQESWKGVLDRAQSPIDIQSATVRAGDGRESQRIQILNPRAEMKVVDNGHAIEVEAKGPGATIRGRHFELTQFHFHATSEHTIDGKFFPLEGHFVFRATNGRLAVIGVMFQEGAANTLASQILDKVGNDKGFTASIAPLLPRRMAYYHYLGSLTTPPLTENVEWYVLRQPVTLSGAQLEAFKTRYSHNNRTVQPLNARPVIAYPPKP